MNTVTKKGDAPILTSHKVDFRARNISSIIGGYFQSRYNEGNNKDKIRNNKIENRKAKIKRENQWNIILGLGNDKKNWNDNKTYQDKNNDIILTKLEIDEERSQQTV